MYDGGRRIVQEIVDTFGGAGRRLDRPLTNRGVVAGSAMYRRPEECVPEPCPKPSPPVKH